MEPLLQARDSQQAELIKREKLVNDLSQSKKVVDEESKKLKTELSSVARDLVRTE